MAVEKSNSRRKTSGKFRLQTLDSESGVEASDVEDEFEEEEEEQQQQASAEDEPQAATSGGLPTCGPPQ
jgi:PBP1b-binding outer membrane lipoprotein LpoB